MTIRLRLALLFMSGTLVMLAGCGTIFVRRLEASLENNLNVTLNARANSIDSAMRSQPLPAPGTPSTPLSLTTANGVYAQILSSGGQVLDSSRALVDDPLISTAQTRDATRHTVITDRTLALGETGQPRNDEPFRILARAATRSRMVIAVAVSRDVVDNATADARNQLIVLSSVVLLLAGTGSWLLTRAALSPVERMREEVSRLGDRDAGGGLRVPDTHDEIARLAQTFNQLLRRLDQALSRERAFVADAGHELKTPLTVLTGELELARRPGRTRNDLLHTIDVAAHETERLVRLTDDLLHIGHPDSAQHSRQHCFDIVIVLDAAIRALSSQATARAVTIIGPTTTHTYVVGDADQIRRAVDNVLTNAIRYSPRESTVTISLARSGELIRVKFADEGPGFPSDFLPIAFDRFTRADNARTRSSQMNDDGVGNGLGLAIVQSVMAAHGGTATARNISPSGAEVTLEWPSPNAGPYGPG